MDSKQPTITPTTLFEITIVAIVLSIILLLNIISTRPALDQLHDFGSFIAAGREAALGHDPYTIDSPLVYLVISQDSQRVLPSPNLNPPISVVFFRWAANLEPMRAVSGWRIISIICFVVGIVSLGRGYQHFITPLRILWAVCAAGFWTTIALGQIYAPIFTLVIGAWLMLEKGRTAIAGILLGAVIAIKPNFMFWLLLLGLVGYRKTTLSAALTFLLLSILPIFVFGPQVYPWWILGLRNYPSLGLMIAGNSSLQSLATRFGYEHMGLFLSLLLAISGLYYTYRHKTSLSANQINSLGIISSILISPFSWPGYAVLTLPIFFSKRQWNWTDKLAAACLAFPYLLVLYLFRASTFNSVFFGWIYGWGLLFLLVSLFLKNAEKRLSILPQQT